MPIAPLDYRRNAPDTSATAAKLRKFESSFYERWSILIALGVLFMFIAPAIVATLVWLHERRHRWSTSHSWTYLFVLWTVILAPILLLIERATRGKMLEDAADQLSDGSLLTAGYRGRAMAGAVFLEICLWGPRMIIAGAEKLLSIRNHVNADRSVAAALLHMLLMNEGGMPTGQLMGATTATPEAFGDALGLLIFLDLVDVSKDGLRAWVSSWAKEKLEKM